MQFLINTFTHWEEPPRARHQVTYALSKYHEVIFVAANKLGLPSIKTTSVQQNIVLVTPYFPILNKIRYRLPLINELYQQWLFRRLARKYKEHKVINFDFTATRIYNFFNNVIYYCNDNFSAISAHTNPSIIARYHQYCESKVAAKARFCVAVSAILRDNLLRFNKNSVEIHLGSPDIDLYNIPINLIPRKNKTIKVCLVGFIKTINVSYDILNLLADDDRFSVTLIGEVENNFLNKIKNTAKLILKGPLTGKKLYEEINQCDVAIAPYSAKLAKDPNSGVGTGSKIYHYFAMGKPVVISYMAGLKSVNLPEKFIYIAKSEKEFPSLIINASEDNSDELIIKRISFAKSNTWDKRMEDFIIYVKMYCKR